MKILITTFTYLPNKDGVAEACRILAEGLAALGHEIWVATSMGTNRQRVDPSSSDISKTHLVDFDLERFPRVSPEWAKEVERYRQFIQEGGFDVIIAQCWDVRTTTCMQAVLPAVPAKKVMVSHGYGAHVYTWHPRITMGIGQWLRDLKKTATLLPELIRTYDRLVFLSPKQGFGRFLDHTLAKWMKHPGIEIISNGIDPNQFPSTDQGFRQRHQIGPGPMVLCVANYSSRKNQCLAVRAFRKANLPDATLVFIGSEFNEAARKAMHLDRKLAAKQTSSKVLFLEKIDREETLSAYVACDLFFLPAKAETQPIVLIEAMAAGKPWLSTDTGCVSEMGGGLICKSESQLIEGLKTLCGDLPLRERLAKEGKEAAVKYHDAKANIAKFDAMLTKLMEG